MRDEETPRSTTYPVAEAHLCEKISNKYRWPLLEVVETGREPLPYECVFQGDRRFPKKLNDPELYEKE